MALRIPWDKQETALLIDAYLKVKNKELSQQDAIKEVSTLLRRRAILSGIEIDEIFRNENGISMQMKIIGGLVDEKPSGLHSATKMFTEMVALYKTKRSEFDKILIQAKGECVMQVNVQEKFFAWLAARVSSAQLSEFYIVCRDIETFCMNKRILVAPLFDTTDFETIQSVANTVRTNRMFQFKYFRQLGKMKKVMDYYLTFLRENPVSKVETVSVVPEASVFEEHIVPVNNIASVPAETVAHQDDAETATVTPIVNADVVQEVEVAEASSITEEVNSAVQDNNSLTETTETDDNLIWNFANERIDFTYTNPIEVSYFGEGRECAGWQNALVKIIEFLLEDYPAIVRGMVGYRFAGVGKVILSGRAGLDRLSKAIEQVTDYILKQIAPQMKL